MRFGFPLWLAALLVINVPAAFADDHKKDAETLGFVEWVVLQDSGVRLKARLDTGAKTSSLHAVNVEPFKKDGKRWVSFEVPLDDHKSPDDAEDDNIVLQFERPVERTVLIKRKGAESQRRYVVKMDFCIAGEKHETQFSLTDRSRFNYAILLGRRFLGDDNVLVDSSDSFQAPKECAYQTLEELEQERDAD